jgi:CheY-like chemotaxis protein
MAEQGELIKILLVEDNPDDILITQRALKEAKIVNQLYVVRDGQEALDFLFHHGSYQDPNASPTPGLILLDINMPRVSGLEVLARIKQDPGLKRVLVVMLTVSKREEDILKGYENGCNSFLQKPVEFDRFVEMVKQVGLYWGCLNVTPPPS